MSINRRRAPSSEVSSEKKLSGHSREASYASLIGGATLGGTIKGDVVDKQGNLHSVKSGKKWQVFLYRQNTISSSRFLKILQPCLDAFTSDAARYFEDREKCIAFKEDYIRIHGRNKAKILPNESVSLHLGSNAYVASKERLALTTKAVCEALRDANFLRSFLGEAMFNNEEVSYLAVQDSTYRRDFKFKVFTRDDVLDILTRNLYPAVSRAGLVPEDYNVGGQKTLLQYSVGRNRDKNIVEIEIRNDSEQHYREVRFNMYSKDTLHLLLGGLSAHPYRELCDGVLLYGRATEGEL